MEIEIKKMETDDEIRGKAHVHWQSWHEAYAGLVDAGYLAALTPKKCEAIAYKWPGNTLVAKQGDRVIGFCAYCRDEDRPDTGEVSAIYILSSFYGQGVGCRLMQAALRALDCAHVFVWVLKGNARAIRFYEKCGFRPDGSERTLTLGAPITACRMVADFSKRGGNAL